MPIKKKKYNARFPPARIKKIMQIDEDVGKVAAAVPVIISRALEMFVETLLKKAYNVTSNRCARTLTPSHIKNCISSEARFDFLKDLVSGVPDLQGDCDDQPQTPITPSPSSPLISSQHFALAGNNQTRAPPAPTTTTTKKTIGGPPLTLPRQISVAPKPRGRPRKQLLDPVSTSNEAIIAASKNLKPKKELNSVKKRGPKKRQKLKRYVDDDENDVNEAFPIEETSDTSDEDRDEEIDDLKVANGNVKSSNGSHVTSCPPPPPICNIGNGIPVTSSFIPPVTSHKSNHIPMNLVSATAAATVRPSYNRSMSYTPPTLFMQRSEHVINSGGVSFSLSYPMPLSPALPPLSYPVTSQKSFFSSGTTQASPLASTVQPVQSSLSHAPPAWPSQSGIDEDYDA